MKSIITNDSRPGEPTLRRNYVSPTRGACYLQGGPSYLVLFAATLLCLLPFSGRAFSTDDPLFIWTAQHIVQQPLNPYGFDVNWIRSAAAMSEVTQNPPLTAYYMAGAAKIVGWSERALHLA